MQVETPSIEDAEYQGRVYGIMVEFEEPEPLLAAARQASAQGYTCLDAYSPFAVEGLLELIGKRDHRVAAMTLIGGLTGGITGYAMQYFAATVSYPFNIGGRPLHSAPAFIPVTFELTILFAAFFALISMLLMNGLPKPYHPVFNVPAFTRASQDRFFLCIRANDARYDPAATRAFLESLGGVGVYDVDA